MTWMHWVLFGLLAAMAIGVALTRGSGSKSSQLMTFILTVGMILLLVLGQPK